ncbi:hypothetical protein Nos7524_2137 [Nostoc sp. PCC 7524]|uniref:hypothetical protein n=1 Tax=Nostoc sp. (strain ATCC 29411 / PCC 7524) TaxID=28072 RepID=UPI00029F4541|nr:hypothetical protein [Nostoc sp. PCC 7524]AFY47987.1 hypothetical protein Nos7524_2137 [Nostoc sp. PCC 7524]
MHKFTSQSIYTHQLKVVLLIALATIIPLSSVLIVVALTSDLNLDHLTMDQSDAAGIPRYIGLFSNIGMLFWCAGAAICLFSYRILKTVNKLSEYTSFLLYSGLLTTLLLLDDFFLLHEIISTKLNISERIVYITYLIIFFRFFIQFRRTIQKTEFLIILAALMCFALSIVADTIWQGIPIFVEDTFKFIGITSWFTYFFRLSLREVSTISHLVPFKQKIDSVIR